MEMKIPSGAGTTLWLLFIYPVVLIAGESFQLLMGLSFPFLHDKHIHTSFFMVRTCSFLTLLCVGVTYTPGQGVGQRPSSYVLNPRRLYEGRGFSNHICFCWTSLYVASGIKCTHVTEPFNNNENGLGR